MNDLARMERAAVDLSQRGRAWPSVRGGHDKPDFDVEGWYERTVLFDPKLLGIDGKGNAVYGISGGMDGPFYRDTRIQPNIVDLASITLATTQKMLWTPGATSPTILPANYWYAGKTVKITANLKWTAVANTNGITIGMAYGAADAPACNVAATAITPVSGTGTFDVFIQGYATCRLIGTAGTLSMWGMANPPIGLSVNGPATFPSAGVTVVSTIDTTVATNGLYFQAARATAAGDTVVCTSLIIEALN